MTATKTITLVIRDGESYDDAQARYEQELADAGFGYEDTILTTEELFAFAGLNEDNWRMVKNYERGILSGGEFDMRRLAS